MLLGLVIRLLWLGGKSLWLDEVFSLRTAQLGQKLLWTGQRDIYYPPLFYLLLEAWSGVGKSEFILRLPVAVFGAACVLLVYALATELADSKVALSVAGLVAFSPLLVWYSQELRSYSILAALSLASTWSCVRLLKRPSWAWWMASVLFMSAALYLHYFAALLVLLQATIAIVLLADRRTNWLRIGTWLTAPLAVILAYWPWLKTPAFSELIRSAPSTYNNLLSLAGERFNITLNLPVIVRLVLVAGIALTVVGGLTLYFITRRVTLTHALESLRKQRWLSFAACLLFIVLLALSVYPRGYSLKRQVVFLWPFALMVFAWLWPWGGKDQRLLVVVLGFSLIASLINVLVIPKDQWRETVDQLGERYQQGDLVVIEPNYLTIPFDYYDRRHLPRLGVPFGDTKPVGEVLCHHPRVWLVLHRVDRDPQARLEEWLGQRATRLDVADYYGIQVELFQVSSPCAVGG